MTTANQGKRTEHATDEENVRDAQEARGHSERVERDETIHRTTRTVNEGSKFKGAMRRMGGMWVQAACVLAGAAVGAGGAVLVQRRMNRTAVGSGTPDVNVTVE